MLNNEIWVDIKDLPYQVSNIGNVRRHPDSKYNQGKPYVKPYINNKGYLCINLYKNSKVHRFQIHRLIAIYFIPNPQGLNEVNHIDGNPLNNAISNLEWCTHSQNLKHAWATGLFPKRPLNASVKRKNATSRYKGVSWSNERKRWCTGVTVKGKRTALGRYTDEIEAAKAYDKYILENNLISLGYSTNFI